MTLVVDSHKNSMEYSTISLPIAKSTLLSQNKQNMYFFVWIKFYFLSFVTNLLNFLSVNRKLLLIILGMYLANHANYNELTVSIIFIISIETLNNKFNNYLDNTMDQIIENKRKSLWYKERLAYTVENIRGRSYNFNLNKNIKNYEKIIKCLHNDIMKLIMNLTLFSIFINSITIKIIFIGIILLINFFSIIFNKKITAIPWSIIKHHKKLNLPYRKSINNSNWINLSASYITKNISLISFSLMILWNIKNHTEENNENVKLIMTLVVFGGFLNNNSSYNCFIKYSNITNNSIKYDFYKSSINKSKNIFCKNLNVTIDNRKILSNVFFKIPSTKTMIIKGVGKNILLGTLFNLIDESSISGSHSSHDINDVFYIGKKYKFNGTLKQYLQLHFSNYSHKELVNIIGDIVSITENVQENIMNNNFTQKNFSQNSMFMVDIFKSMGISGHMIIIDNPGHLDSTWIEEWHKRYKYVIILTDQEEIIKNIKHEKQIVSLES